MTAKDTTPRRLSDYGNIHSAEETKAIDEVEGIELKITDFSLAKGDFGEYAFIYAVDPNGELLTIRTGATLILEALKDAKAKDNLPVLATFKKRGLAWICS